MSIHTINAFYISCLIVPIPRQFIDQHYAHTDTLKTLERTINAEA